MKNPNLKLLTFAIAGLVLCFLPNAAKAQSQYFGVSSGIVNGGTYSWDAANWSVVGGSSSGPFTGVWTNGDFARFYGGAGDSYTVTVNQAECNIGMYNDNATSILTINDAGNGTGSLQVTNGQQGFLVTSGSITIINVPITSSMGGPNPPGGIVPELSGSLYLGATNTYAGGTALGDSGNTLVYFDNNSAFSTGVITLNRTANFSTLGGYGGSALTISNNFSIYEPETGTSWTGVNFPSSTNTPVTFLGNWTNGSSPLALDLRNSGGSSSPLTLSGQIFGSSALIFSANAGGDNTAGTTILSATNYGFTGNVEVVGPAFATYGGNTNATLELGVANAIATASRVVLYGGNLNGGGFNHTNNGTLVLSNSSSLYFGGGNMSFADSSALPWTGVLNLADWVGAGSTYGGTQFRIGTSAAGLTAAQLADIEFTNSPLTLGDAAIDPNGYIYFAAAAPGPSFTVTTTNSLISQPNTYGNFTKTSFLITRGGSLASTLTVNYTVSGTALGVTNAASGYPSYPATFTATPSLSGSVVFSPNETSTNIVITAVADSIARPTTTLTLTVSPSGGYALGVPPTATITILNTAEDEVFAATGAVTNMYKVYSNDYVTITLTRWGDTNASAFTVNTFNYSGTAMNGTDFTGTNGTAPAVTINPGDVSDTVFLSPLINGHFPVNTNNLPYTGNKTIIASVATGSGYTGSTNAAVLTIIDSAYPTAAYLYYDPLTNSMDSTNWAVTSVNDNMQTNAIDDYIDFAYDLYDNPRDPNYVYSTQEPIPFPPNGGATALRLTVNKSQQQGEGAGAAVNLYLTNAIFSGNYAVRFNMNLICGANPNYTTEGALFGINHGMETGPGSFTTNWFAGSPVLSGWAPPPTGTNWESDGIWCFVSVDNGFAFLGGPAAYMEFTGLGGKLPNTGFASPLIAQVAKTQFSNNFKTNIFTTVNGPGLVGNASPDSTSSTTPYADSSWADVEWKQFDNVVTITINKIVINVYTNTTTFTNGYLMLGYEDPFDSVGAGDAAVYYSNLRVVRLTAPLITEIAPQGNNYVFDFTTTDGDLTPSSFTVVGSATVNGTYTPVAGATITQLGNGVFQATVPTSGPDHFYQVQQPL